MPIEATTPLIQLENVHKRFGRKRVLRGASLSVCEGQVVALLGSNGAGKTTLMNMVCGLSKPDSGDITLGGVSLQKAGQQLRRYIGLVTHSPLLYGNLSAEENLRFFAKMYGVPQPEERIHNVLESVNLWTRRRDVVRTYSRGMVQRLAIARAVLHNPPVLLLDEPDTGLDQESAQMLHSLLRQLGATNRAILLTTHNLVRALEWADAVTVLADGKLSGAVATESLTVDSLRILYNSDQALS